MESRRARLDEKLRRFVEHPVTNLVVGLVLIVTGGAETIESFYDDYRHLRLRAHHGLLFFGFFNMLSSLPSLIEGLDHHRRYLEH